MAKYKIIKNFTDKYDKSIKYKVGKTEDFDDERAKEILKVGKLIEKIEEKPTENDEKIEENDEKIEEKPRKRGKNQ